jgi:hypothetical protein
LSPDVTRLSGRRCLRTSQVSDEASHVRVSRVPLPVDLGNLVADRGIRIVGEVLRDHVGHEGQASTVDPQVERRVHVRVVGLDVLQHIDGADGELAAEIATHAERLDDVELPAQPAHQFERGLHLITRRFWLHRETNLVVNHGELLGCGGFIAAGGPGA